MSMKRDTSCRVSAIVFFVLFAVLWIADPTFSEDPTAQRLWKSLLQRLLGAGAFFSVLLYREYRVFSHRGKKTAGLLMLAFLVAVNNFPLISVLSGNAKIERPELIVLYAAESLSIGLFEELAFRAVLFPALLERMDKKNGSVFWVTFVSSAVFGLVHLFNLIEGAGFGATVMQVGYSFLIGGMCAILLLRTGCIWWCVLVHAIYDFCGGLLPTLGSGHWWDTPTVVLTAVLGVFTAFFMVRALLKIRREDILILPGDAASQKNC